MVQRRLASLTTHQLEYLTAVAENDTWAQAAGELGVSSSALSQGLSELERRLGITLFERQGRSRTLTQAGLRAVDYARQTLATISDLSSWAEATRSGIGGVVRLGMIDVAAVHHYPRTLARFRQQRPEVEFHLSVAPSASLLNDVQNGRLDLAILIEPTTPLSEVSTTLARTEELAIYVPPPSAGGPTRVSDNPADWGPWVTFPPRSHTRQHIAGSLRRLGAELRVEGESNQPEVLRAMVQLGMGWTVLPAVQAELIPKPLRRARPEPLTSRNLLLVKRSGTALTPAAEHLSSLLIDSETDEVAASPNATSS